MSPGQIVVEPIRPLNIPRKEKDFQGMLEYKEEDEPKLIKNLILGKYMQMYFFLCILSHKHHHTAANQGSQADLNFKRMVKYIELCWLVW